MIGNHKKIPNKAISMSKTHIVGTQLMTFWLHAQIDLMVQLQCVCLN
ncbi:unnamed protein product [Oikopleura dioica]|uniref:Uncharacterized protein n=1 Tax=Oikopleura dioica TaxID=34765 RepID=E4YVQ4_OIKDI|nr:unnamed protein product [Oikopleura dioica]